MDDIYLIIVVALGVLAIGDLIVGVSNDAVNFLTSAVGSKAIPFKTIMVLASLGVACGALFSSGLMEVARKGIFNPDQFYFDEIMLIFVAVMLTDILLLDFFNTIGLPTSTTVSIVFELLGAAVFMSLIKIQANSGSISDLYQYINTSKAIQIILGILLSVVVALTIGAIIQWITRLLLSYNFLSKENWVSSIFGSVALSSIMYFILIKGIQGSPFSSSEFSFLGNRSIKEFIELELFLVIFLNLTLWYLISFILIKYLNVNIYKVIIAVGTFALALAFAGNDLVNFIGVPIAAFQSYEIWSSSGMLPSEFNMRILSSKVPTPTLLLFFSGLVMVGTLWFSKKAKSVLKTSLDLSNQNYVKERFEPNIISIFLVKFFSKVNKLIFSSIPKFYQNLILNQFKIPKNIRKKFNKNDAPSFDMLRASINLIVASVLISIATSYKLPLSTTYVTFMVAMGTSLADRAWGEDSAVYRVSGVINVIGGWFLTAIIAFIVSGIIVSLIFVGGISAIAIILFIILTIIGKNYLNHKRKNSIQNEEVLKLTGDSSEEIIKNSKKNVENIFKRILKIYSQLIDGLSKNEIESLSKSKKNIKKLSSEVENLRENTFYFIKNLNETDKIAGHFYITTLGYIHDITQDLEYTVLKGFKHVKNGHKKLKLSQIRDLNDILDFYKSIYDDLHKSIKNQDNSNLKNAWLKKSEIIGFINKKIDDQIIIIRDEETSPKNTTLYFNILLKAKEIFNVKLDLIKEHYNSAEDKEVL